jgi:p70 ribosomal S6 kinase
MSSNSQKKKKKKNLHSLLATNLSSKLTISVPSSAQDPDFDFSEVFGPSTPHHHHHPNPVPSESSSPPSTSSPALPPGDPPVIYNRSHSFVGPSPRFTLSRSLPIHTPEFESESESDTEARNGPSGADTREDLGKFGPGDFEILRVVGQGAFGKVFQVVRKRARASPPNGECKEEIDGDGIYAMKVMRKDTIIKKNHVDYMKAERDILTKVVHPFIVQLRYSFQVLFQLQLVLYHAYYLGCTIMVFINIWFLVFGLCDAMVQFSLQINIYGCIENWLKKLNVKSMVVIRFLLRLR